MFGTLGRCSQLALTVKRVERCGYLHALFTGLPMCTKTNRHSVYITRKVPTAGVQLLKQTCDVTEWLSDEPVPRHELLSQVRGVHGLFCIMNDKIDKELLHSAGPQLKVIGTMSAGYDHVDLTECQRLGIPVGYTPDVLTDACVEFTVALLLATSRRLIEGVEAVKSGEWGPWIPLWLCGKPLVGSTVGIVGLGRIGLGVAKSLRSFGISRLLYTGRQPKDQASYVNAEFASFDCLLKESDFVVVTCAFNEETKNLFNKDAFQKMKNDAVFVNTSRGGVVDQDSLYQALVSGSLGAAGIDVTAPEPLPTDSPLLGLTNCIVTPHIGSGTTDARIQMSVLTARNILAGLQGNKLPEQINIQ